MAIFSFFCPNLGVLDGQSIKRDLLIKTFPNTYVIGLRDVSGLCHAGEKLQDVLVGTLDRYSIRHKVGSITVDSASSNLAMFNKIDDALSGDDINEFGGTPKVRCMNHVLNIIFNGILEKFEKQNQDLVSRIDGMKIETKPDLFLRKHFRKYAAKIIPKNNDTRSVSRYRQFFAFFLSLTNDLQQFYLQNHIYKHFQPKGEDTRLFLYETKEI